MKKQLQRKYGGFIALLSVSVLMFLGLGACMNPLQPPVERGPGNADGSTGVRISIVNGEARTLLPSTAFSKYVLSFSNSEGVTAPSDITLTAANTESVSLDPANWTIEVTAYVKVAGVDVAAAEGSAQVSLGSGEQKPVSIRVSAKLDGEEDGYFSYNVSYPGDVSYGYLNVYDSEQTPVIGKYLPSEPSGNRIPLPAGYYALRVSLETSYSVAVRTEIVHIYPGMETRGDYAFTEADFGTPIAISGTVDLSGLGTIDWAEMRLYQDSGFSEGYAYAPSPSGIWSWTARTLPFNHPTDLYMQLVLQFSDGSTLTKRIPAPFSVYDQAVNAPAIGAFTVNQFNLGGTVDLTVLNLMAAAMEVNIDYVTVTAYEDKGPLSLELGSTGVDLAGGSWSLNILTEEAPPLQVLIILRAEVAGIRLYDERQDTLNVVGSHPGLDLTPGPVIAGTTINGVGTGNGNYSYLFVPDTSGDYGFTLSTPGSQNIDLALYDALGNELGYVYGLSYAALSSYLTAGVPCFIQLYLGGPYQAFQFQVDPISQVSLDGTVDFSGLSSWDTASAEVLAFAFSGSNAEPLGTGTVNLPGGAWSVSVPSFGEIFVALAALSTGGEGVLAAQTVGMSGGVPAIALSPEDSDKNVATGAWHIRSTDGVVGDWLLWIPESAGTYVLDAERTDSIDPYMYLYDGLTGNQIDYDDDGGGSVNSRIQRDDFQAGYPYLIRVRDFYNRPMPFRFKAEAVVAP